jgi:putative ABC transport system ATP-binding protein
MIKIENLNKYFYKGEDRELHALKNINLSIEKGEYSLLTGPSGCGKTTLLNVIGALDSFDSGKIYFEGRELGALNEDEKTTIRLNEIGFVFQAYNLVPVLNVEENIGFIMRLRGFSDSEIRERVKEIATILEIDTKLKSLPSTLSGGQQQRVAVARAVASKPKIILADEPTANLDSKNSKALMDMMRSLNVKENISIVFASHDTYILENVDRVIKLNDGEIIES